MGWTFNNPLHSMATDDQNESAKKLWEAESLGGITEDNNRLPQPVVGLLILTIITAFLITFPLWGQRPHAAMYVEYIAMMDDPNVVGKPDDEAMDYIVKTVKAKGSEWAALQERHPLEMDDLRLLRPHIEELQRKGAHLDEWTVLGDRVVLANFEGNWRDQAKGDRERKQPWWDKGYTIDIFFIVVFCVAVVIAVKRLPPYTYKPKHHH